MRAVKHALDFGIYSAAKKNTRPQHQCRIMSWHCRQMPGAYDVEGATKDGCIIL